MKRLTDTQYLIFGLIGIVLAAYIVALVNPARPEPGPLSAESAKRDGALALRLWLEESGYIVQTFTDEVSLDDLDLLLVLNPPAPYSVSEAREVWEWINSGGRLIAAGTPFRIQSLLDVFDVRLEDFYVDTEANSQTAPLLQSPTVQAVPIQGYYRISSTPDDAVAHIIDGTNTVLISFSVARGDIWVSGTSYPFTNLGLQDADSARLILNMLAGLPPGAVIGFDEALRLENPPTLLRWLFNTPPGFGIVLSMGLTMTFLAMRGRHFGRSVPLPEDRLLREPVEYIQAIANLYRRSGQRAVILAHYKTQLRRQLCERYGLRLTINDNDLIHTITNRSPEIDQAELTKLFERLSSQRVSEQELVSVALALDEWLRRKFG